MQVKTSLYFCLVCFRACRDLTTAASFVKKKRIYLNDIVCEHIRMQNPALFAENTQFFKIKCRDFYRTGPTEVLLLAGTCARASSPLCWAYSERREDGLKAGTATLHTLPQFSCSASPKGSSFLAISPQRLRFFRFKASSLHITSFAAGLYARIHCKFPRGPRVSNSLKLLCCRSLVHSRLVSGRFCFL